ncbi:MAG: amidase [Ktedonobacteraceae bacterium]|nr:amidase [Ktedonobacteraceae bacterium]
MFYNTSLVQTASRLRSGQIDLAASIRTTCERITDADMHIHALIPETGRCKRLQEEAWDLQERFPDPAGRPALYGVLCGVKDVLHVAGLPTRAGSRLPLEVLAGPEAACVTRLRDAGALVLGKTVSTEFAFFAPGPTRNPRNLEYTPGGSSSGSAAAVAAGLCPLALGTQTIGSIIRPAAYCGIVGFKPSFGRIPTEGLVFVSPSVDTIGCFAQDVEGIALAAEILCDHWQPAAESNLPVLGVPDGPYLEQTSPEGLAAFAQQLALLAQAGYTVRRVAVLPDIADINTRHRRLIRAEMAQIHAGWFARYEALYHSLTIEAIREGLSVSAEELAEARTGCAALRAQLEQMMQQHGIDLWVCPAATGPAPHGLATTGDPCMNLPWTHAGLPALTLPAGLAKNGLPLGLQLIGTFMADEWLVAWAGAMAEIIHL